jgi:hypothetical protein
MAQSSTSFRKGQSGNPAGRSKVVGEIRDLARSHTLSAMDTLVTIMQDESANASARVTAAQEILNRGYGKPTQAVEIETKTSLVDLLVSLSSLNSDDEGGTKKTPTHRVN